MVCPVDSRRPPAEEQRCRPFVLLDRDGTVIVEKHYLRDPEGVELLPGVGGALRALQARAFGLALVTNQSGIGRGYYTEEDMHRVNERVLTLLRQEGVELAAVYHCPHTPEDACACRKPLAGLGWRAAAELGMDPALSYVVGDKACDVGFARNLGAQGILVRTGHGAAAEKDGGPAATFVADDLAGAARWILARSCA